MMFQYRKRYEVTCDIEVMMTDCCASPFQYRKRYEVTCDETRRSATGREWKFQYRKRYEVTCDGQRVHRSVSGATVSIPQAV